MNGYAKRWLKQHRTGERNFKASLVGFFKGQADRVVEALSDFDVITPAAVPLVFNEADEHERLKPVVRRHLKRSMVIGASVELEALRDAQKSVDDPIDSDVPETVRRRIGTALDELEEQPYWQSIQAETSENLAAIIRQGIEEEVSNYQIGMRIREWLGGMPANKRAQRIARTEVTGAMNAGHEAARQELYESGLVIGKKWVTVGDEDVRVDHIALHDVTAGPNELFSVGGTDAPYPGWWGLPARQRIHCRCTTLSVLA